MAGLNDLETLRLESTSDRVSDQLRRLILDGSLKPGEQLGEAKIAEQLGVSRAPVREALQLLVQERLLTSTRNRGVRVAEFTNSDIQEIYEARQVIESHAALRIISNGAEAMSRTAEELRAILAQLGGAIRAADWVRVSSIDLEFHTHLVSAAANSRLGRLYSILSGETLACINRLEIAYPSGEDLVEEHSHMIELLEKGESQELLAAIDRHMKSAVAHLTSLPVG